MVIIHFNTYEQYLFSANFRTQWWLQHVSILLTGANRLNIRGVDQSPEVVAVVTSIQTKTQTNPS